MVGMRRIRRTRKTSIDQGGTDEKSKGSIFDDDDKWVLPKWRDEGELEEEKRLKAASLSTHGYAEAIESAIVLEKRYYQSITSFSIWPQGYAPYKGITREDIATFYRIKGAVDTAITAHLIDHLDGLQMKFMLMLSNRTFGWKKFWEGMPHSHMLGGVFKRGVRLQAPIASNKTHLNSAIRGLEIMKVIKAREARSKFGPVRVFSIDIQQLLRLAENRSRAAVKTTRLRGWD